MISTALMIDKLDLAKKVEKETQGRSLAYTSYVIPSISAVNSVLKVLGKPALPLTRRANLMTPASSQGKGTHEQDENDLSRALVSATWVALAHCPGRRRRLARWRGPHRDSICKESGLLHPGLPRDPRCSGKVKGLGEGLSGPAIVGDRLYTLGNSEGKEKVLALDLAHDGKLVWSSAIGDIRHTGGAIPVPGDAQHRRDRLYAWASRRPGLHGHQGGPHPVEP